jgi:hypothetical protein
MVIDQSVIASFGIWPSACFSLKAMTKEQVRLDGLLFSSDTAVLGVMNQILDTFAIKTEICGELDLALDAVSHRRLDAVIVDWTGVRDPNRVICAARKSSPNSNSTIVSIVDQGSEAHALLAGANFMIHKPMDLDHAAGVCGQLMEPCCKIGGAQLGSRSTSPWW